MQEHGEGFGILNGGLLMAKEATDILNECWPFARRWKVQMFGILTYSPAVVRNGDYGWGVNAATFITRLECLLY
jgi:hypothetical protein